MQSEAEQLDRILRRNCKPNGREFSQTEIESLSLFYRLVMRWNPHLHLTTITKPQEFFERHIFESIFAEEKILPSINQVWDIGSGAGVPGLVIAICRPMVAVSLIEASRKKALFLEEAIAGLGITNAHVVKARFESLVEPPELSCITVRAIEGMEQMIRKLVNFGDRASQMIFLGGEKIEDAVRLNLHDEWRVEDLLIPGSARRYLVNAIRST